MGDLLYRSRQADDGVVNEVHLQYIDFQVMRVKKGCSVHVSTGEREMALIVNGGDAEMAGGDVRFTFTDTRTDPFRQKPSLALFPPGTDLTVLALTDLEFSQAATFRRDGCCGKPVLIRASDVTEVPRGAEGTARTIRTLIPKGVASNLLLFEVITEPGNWSSYPPHKHDTEDPPRESLLEEIYYYRIEPSGGFVFQRIFDDSLELDESYAVRDRDIVAIPRGYHPTSAAPGFACYTQAVMAGPTKEWNFTVHRDFAHLMNWTK